MYDLGRIPILPPDWKYTFNFTINTVNNPASECALAYFRKDDGNYIYDMFLKNGNLVINFFLSDFPQFTHPVMIDQTYSFEMRLHYQGILSGRNKWVLTIHIDGVQIYNELKDNLKLFKNVKHLIGKDEPSFSECTAEIKNPELTIFEEGI